MGTALSNPPKTQTSASFVRYQVLAGLCVATMIAYIDRGCIQMAVDPIRADLGLSEQAMGFVLSAFFAAYAVCQLPSGWVGHVWGSRAALPFFAAGWSAATGLCALATGPLGLTTARAGMGAAEAGIFPCALNSLARWFPPARRAWVSGVLGSFMGIGGFLGTLLTGLLLVQMPWRWVFAFYAIPGLVWAAWFAVWFRNRPQDHPAVNAAELDLIGDSTAEPEDAEPVRWGAILSSPTMWWVNGQQFFRAAGSVFYMSWFPIYLQRTRGVTLEQAGFLAGLPHLAMIFGSLGGGLAADWLLARTGSRRVSRQGLAAGSLIVCSLFILVSSTLTDATAAALIISLGSFFGSLAGPSAYAVAIDAGGKQVAPVFSVMNTAGNVGAILFPPLAPFLVGLTGNWDLVFLVFAGLHLAAAGCWLALNPSTAIAPPLSPED